MHGEVQLTNGQWQITKKAIIEVSATNNKSNIETFKYITSDIIERINNPTYVQSYDITTNIAPTQGFDAVTDFIFEQFGIEVQVDNKLQTTAQIKDGIITVNKKKMTGSTLFHEVAHPFIEMIKKN